MIELTEQQWQAVKNGEAVRVTVPEIGEDVVLLSAAQYESLRAAIDPIEPFIGALPSDVLDWASQHDKYLGQALVEEMRASDDPRR
jgi:hypothetical protein